MKSNTFNFGLEDANFSKIELAEKIKKYLTILIQISNCRSNRGFCL